MSRDPRSSALIVFSRWFFDVLHCHAPPVMARAAAAIVATARRPATSNRAVPAAAFRRGLVVIVVDIGFFDEAGRSRPDRRLRQHGGLLDVGVAGHPPAVDGVEIGQVVVVLRRARQRIGVVLVVLPMAGRCGFRVKRLGVGGTVVPRPFGDGATDLGDQIGDA